jgi:hypothetical protein
MTSKAMEETLVIGWMRMTQSFHKWIPAWSNIALAHHCRENNLKSSAAVILQLFQKKGNYFLHCPKLISELK